MHRQPFPAGLEPFRNPDTQCPQGLSKRTLLEFGFLVFVVAPLIHYGQSPLADTFSVTFAAIVLEAWPFLLIGALVAGFLEEFVSHHRLGVILSAGRKRTLFLAAGMGILFPVCECAVVPVVRKLLRKGVPFSAAVAFMLAGPIVNPIVFASTAVAYGLDWEVAMLRMVFSYFIAVFVGFVVGGVFSRRDALIIQHAVFLPQSSDTGVGERDLLPLRHRMQAALGHAMEEFLDMSPFLVMGAFMAAMVQSTVDRNLFVSLGEHPFPAIAVMMSHAFILSICSDADAFVAASFQLSLPLSAQMAFMVMGPMLDLKLVFMFLGVFRKRTIWALAGTTFLAVLGAMMLFQELVYWVLS